MSDLTYFCRTFTLLTMNSPQVYLGALRVHVTHAHKHARLADHARALWGIVICSSHIISLCRSPTPGAIVSLAPLPVALLPASGIIDHPDCHNACSDCGPGAVHRETRKDSLLMFHFVRGPSEQSLLHLTY